MTPLLATVGSGRVIRTDTRYPSRLGSRREPRGIPRLRRELVCHGHRQRDESAVSTPIVRAASRKRAALAEPRARKFLRNADPVIARLIERAGALVRAP